MLKKKMSAFFGIAQVRMQLLFTNSLKTPSQLFIFSKRPQLFIAIETSSSTFQCFQTVRSRNLGIESVRLCVFMAFLPVFEVK